MRKVYDMLEVVTVKMSLEKDIPQMADMLHQRLDEKSEIVTIDTDTTSEKS